MFRVHDTDSPLHGVFRMRGVDRTVVNFAGALQMLMRDHRWRSPSPFRGETGGGGALRQDSVSD